MTQSFNCPACGAGIDLDEGSDPVVICSYCKGTVVVPEELRKPLGGIPPAGGIHFNQNSSYRIETPAAFIPLQQPNGKVKLKRTIKLTCFIIFVFISTIILFGLGILIWTALDETPTINELVSSSFTGPAKLVMSFGGKGNGAGYFSDLRYVSVDPIGEKILTADYGGGIIQFFNREGIFLTQWQLEDKDIYLFDAEIDRKGNAYLVYGGDIHIFNLETGKEIDLIKPPDNYSFFYDIALTADDGLIAVINGETLIRYNANKMIEWVLPNAISSISGDIATNARLEVDGHSEIFVLSRSNYAVYRFSAQGQFVDRFGSQGDEQGQFTAPYAIAIDNRGRLFITDFDGVMIFSPDGRYISTINTQGFIYGLEIDDENRLYTAGYEQMVRIYELNLDQ